MKNRRRCRHIKGSWGGVTRTPGPRRPCSRATATWAAAAPADDVERATTVTVATATASRVAIPKTMQLIAWRLTFSPVPLLHRVQQLQFLCLYRDLLVWMDEFTYVHALPSTEASRYKYDGSSEDDPHVQPTPVYMSLRASLCRSVGLSVFQWCAC